MTTQRTATADMMTAYRIAARSEQAKWLTSYHIAGALLVLAQGDIRDARYYASEPGMANLLDTREDILRDATEMLAGL